MNSNRPIMERYEGVLRYGLHYAGSRSEGCYARLEAGDDTVIPLCRKGVLPNNDAFFEPYDGVRVSIMGTMSHGWLVVEQLDGLLPAVEISTATDTSLDAVTTPAPGAASGPESVQAETKCETKDKQ